MGKIYFYWDNKYSVQFTEIDEQHKKLFDILNDLYNAFVCKTHKDEIQKIIEKLIDYTKFHFSYEEKYFDKFNYTFKTEHIKEHQTFIETANQFKAEAEKNPGALTYKTMTFLKDWIYNHILVNDKKYIDCFKENGLS